ncbi:MULTISPECIES: Yip1 family protein [Streptomyces]|uniref:Yip1 family protein n=1 Tax=Streptomyces TaxID=1883 RepID=UPI000370938C|nr:MULTISPECIES: Yip1 family protein [Streptomyces]MCD9903427.1 YIP1 family protein [Streptomyces sp. MT29]MZF57248.1 YIP1 family protein [Streptomyces sp. SID5594]PVC92961.1 YIP1 family protein [Streptomyces sp. CS090A]WOP10525.1 Yip1 family protein [Streptomyces cyaneofuscatus]
MAGFRIGRGRDNRTPQQPQQQRQQPYGGQAPQPPYGAQPWPTAGGAAPPQYGAPQGTPYNGGGYPGGGHDGRHGGHHGGPGQGPNGTRGGHGEPEYFGDPYAGPAPHDPYANNPGHTQAFSIDDSPYGDGDTYRAGSAPAQPAGPRLPWKALLTGIVTRPGPTFWQMRDYAVWGPALIVTFLYGLLALFGFDQAREEAINATISTAIPYVLFTGVGFVIGGLVLGAVTNALARQLGGTGSWQPTVGLSMLIMSITDAPRLLFAVFLGGENSLVQIMGWLTWLAAGALFTSMVSKSHDLPWPKALGASAIQLLALLSIIKLGTI